MPTSENATFDFDDNLSASEDYSLRIRRRVSTPNTLDSILKDTMTGDSAAKNARCARGNARSKVNMAQANNAQGPEPEELRKKTA